MAKDDVEIHEGVKFFNMINNHLRAYLCQAHAQHLILIFHSILATTDN